MADEIVVAETVTVPTVDVKQSLQAWHAYQQLCRELLTQDDYVTIKGVKARKRSGWAKLRRFLGVTVEIIKETPWETEDDWGWDFVVRAYLPNGRFEDGDGSCSANELLESHIRPTRHNVRAKALTRAKNRATADLIGGGEVSAEELAAAPINGEKQEAKTPHWIENPKVRKRFWRWTREELGLSSDEVHEALGVESVKDFVGTMQDAKEAIMAYITRRLAEKKRANIEIHKPVARRVEVLKGEEAEKFRQIIENEAAEELYGE